MSVVFRTNYCLSKFYCCFCYKSAVNSREGQTLCNLIRIFIFISEFWLTRAFVRLDPLNIKKNLCDRDFMYIYCKLLSQINGKINSRSYSEIKCLLIYHQLFNKNPEKNDCWSVVIEKYFVKRSFLSYCFLLFKYYIFTVRMKCVLFRVILSVE